MTPSIRNLKRIAHRNGATWRYRRDVLVIESNAGWCVRTGERVEYVRAIDVRVPFRDAATKRGDVKRAFGIMRSPVAKPAGTKAGTTVVDDLVTDAAS